MGQARKQVKPGSAGSRKFAAIRQTELIPAPPHELYSAFTNPEKYSEFTGTEVTFRIFFADK
jgi:uncharacterized protein YndB with AHSA1/START domain